MAAMQGYKYRLMIHTIHNRTTGKLIAAGDEDSGSMVKLEGCWYYNPDIVDMEHLVITNRTYNCPYKGICYWIDLETPESTVRNIGFVYRHPMQDYEFIAGRIAFYGRDTSGTVASVDAEQTA